MNLDTLTKQSAVTLLKHLLEEGRITEDECLSALVSAPSDEMKRTVDFVHQLLCQLPHSLLEDQVVCGYQFEESVKDIWCQPFHQAWLKRTIELMNDLELESEVALLKCYNAANPLLTMITRLENENPAALELAFLVKGLENVQR